MNFHQFKEKLLANAKEAQACSSEYKRALNAKNIDELIEVIKDNIGFTRGNNIVTNDMSQGYEKPELFNIGKDNTGLFNSGDLNSGDLNSGDRNSGDLNSGYRNSGYRNSGDRNSGYRNSGDRNSGDLNSGDRNSGDLNSGDRNSGDLNSGYRNSGDLNSGYRNSGIFCNRKKEDTVIIFNKESNMTWSEWYNHTAYDAALYLKITEWINWDNMSEEDKKEYPKAFVCGGRLIKYSYHEAWSNLWETLSEEQKNSFKTLPNYDSEIFKEITGIELK